ncbi:Protein HitA [Gammaproteobacteria bacterium]
MLMQENLMNDCIFCQIIAGNLPAQRLYEDEHVLVIPDKFPKAEVHLLVLPRIHIPSLREITAAHDPLMAHIMRLLPKVAQEHGLVDGFRTIINTGVGGDQVIFHIHVHIMGKRPPSVVRGS